MTALSKDDLNRAALFALRHYVPFSYYAKSPEIMEFRDGVAFACVCSAFVLQSRGIWCLVTAGHVLDDIEAERQRGIEQVSFRLWDGWVPGAQHRNPIPFDYDEAPKIRLNEHGLDYGLIPLRPLHVAALRANGVVPIGASHYEKDWPGNFEGYAMIGTPGATVDVKRHGERSTLFSQSVSVIHLVEESNPPSELVQRNPRFYGRILVPEGSAEWEAIGKDIRGMSGGPVIGVRRDNEGVKYWVVGVQSGWLESRRTVAASFFQAFARFVDARLAEATSDD
jgi:hypothetical protein